MRGGITFWAGSFFVTLTSLRLPQYYECHGHGCRVQRPALVQLVGEAGHASGDLTCWVLCRALLRLIFCRILLISIISCHLNGMLPNESLYVLASQHAKFRAYALHYRICLFMIAYVCIHKVRNDFIRFIRMFLNLLVLSRE